MLNKHKNRRNKHALLNIQSKSNVLYLIVLFYVKFLNK